MKMPIGIRRKEHSTLMSMGFRNLSDCVSHVEVQRVTLDVNGAICDLACKHPKSEPEDEKDDGCDETAPKVGLSASRLQILALRVTYLFVRPLRAWAMRPFNDASTRAEADTVCRRPRPFAGAARGLSRWCSDACSATGLDSASVPISSRKTECLSSCITPW